MDPIMQQQSLPPPENEDEGKTGKRDDENGFGFPATNPRYAKVEKHLESDRPGLGEKKHALQKDPLEGSCQGKQMNPGIRVG